MASEFIKEAAESSADKTETKSVVFKDKAESADEKTTGGKPTGEKSAEGAKKCDPKLEQMVEEHTGLVKSVALRLSRAYGEETEDLIQIGYIGLIKAAKKFEPERGLKFSTYAVPVIAGEIKSQLRDQGTIKVGRGLKADAAAVRRAENAFAAENGRSPRISELAAATGLAPERVNQALQAADAMKNFEDFGNVCLTENEEERNITKMDIASTITDLQPKARQVIILRYYKDMTQSQVARVMGISQVQVCRIEKKALNIMGKNISF